MSRHKEFDREDVLEKAMQVFWSQGYECTSVQNLVDAMGINRGSIYGTFGDKHALHVAALDRFYNREIGPMLAPLERPGSVRVALREIFRTIVERAALRRDRRGWMISNAAVELCPGDAAVGEIVAKGLKRIEGTLRQALVRAKEAGELGPHHEPRALARYLVNGLNGLAVVTKAIGDPETLRDIVDVTLSVLDLQPPTHAHRAAIEKGESP